MMKLQQMRFLCEIAKRRYNLSEVARTLYVSQPVITRRIQLLEDELGFDVLVRRGRRIVGLSREGAAVLEIAERMTNAAADLRQLSTDYKNRTSMHLTVATTHFHARYTLFDSIQKFRKIHSEAALFLQQVPPADIVKRLINEEADVGVCVSPSESVPDLISIPYQAVERTLIVPREHPLVGCQHLTLEQLLEYPLILYDRTFSAGWNVMCVFEERNLQPNVVLVATDADVIKSYVAAGLGVAIVQSKIFQPKHDAQLRAVDISHIFKPAMSTVMLKPRIRVRKIVYDFMNIALPDVGSSNVRAAIEAHM